jgi:hypothetical protein
VVSTLASRNKKSKDGFSGVGTFWRKQVIMCWVLWDEIVTK